MAGVLSRPVGHILSCMPQLHHFGTYPVHWSNYIGGKGNCDLLTPTNACTFIRNVVLCCHCCAFGAWGSGHKSVRLNHNKPIAISSCVSAELNILGIASNLKCADMCSTKAKFPSGCIITYGFKLWCYTFCSAVACFEVFNEEMADVSWSVNQFLPTIPPHTHTKKGGMGGSANPPQDT